MTGASERVKKNIFLKLLCQSKLIQIILDYINFGLIKLLIFHYDEALHVPIYNQKAKSTGEWLASLLLIC